MTILIIGGSGFLGAELVRQAAAAGHATAATFATRPGSTPEASWHALDLRDVDRIEAVMADVEPRVVVDATSGGPDWTVTAEGPVRLAMAAAKHGSRLVHVSSDAVFSGVRVHYDESCLPDPLTPYGAAKAAAETGVRLANPGAVVARTSLIIGDQRSDHVRAVHELAAGARTGVLFTDDIRCPVHVADLAAALLELASSDRSGVHHLAGTDPVSRHELGMLIARRDGLDASRLPTGLRADSPLPGALDVRLDSRATQERLRTRLRGAREFLAPGTRAPFPRRRDRPRSSLSAGAMDSGLAHEESAFINFRRYMRDPKEHGFRWVDIKQLRFSAEPVDDGGLLAALIGHEQFRDDYAGGGVLPDGPRHGPYWVGSITPDLYAPIGQEKAVQILREWAAPLRDLPTGLEADLRREVFARVAEADGIYYLNELGDEAVHDWGRVHDCFHEFVLVDRAAGRITLIVAADD